QNIPFEYLRDYLTESGDPPPRTLHTGRRRRRRRAKRIAVQYHSPSPVSTTSVSRPWLATELIIPTRPTSRRDPCDSHTTNNLSPVFPSASSSIPSSSCSPPLDGFTIKRARFSPVVSLPFTPTPESETGLSEDSTTSSVGRTVGCLCGVADPDGDCLTDCSSSTTTTSTTNDEEDTDSVHHQFSPLLHSSQGPDTGLA
ncbi:hypothetical protein FBUS_04866, partial [Fasciolopsis buskii]